MGRSLIVLVACAVLMACSSASTRPPAHTACDPLATHPTTLATTLGVGEVPLHCDLRAHPLGQSLSVETPWIMRRRGQIA